MLKNYKIKRIIEKISFLTLFFCQLINSINLEKVCIDKLYVTNPTYKIFYLLVEFSDKKAGFVLHPNKTIKINQKNNCIKSIKAINIITGQSSDFFVLQLRSGDTLFKILNSSSGSDLIYGNFDKYLKEHKQFYQDAISNKEIKYNGNISSKWYYCALDKAIKPKDFINLIKSNYNKIFSTFSNSNSNNFEDQKNSKIPNTIHQIWLGGSVPEEYKIYQEKWKKMHPTWQYKLWTDQDLKNFKFATPEIKEAFDTAPNKAGQADILKFEILRQYGGVYIDIDTEPLEPIDFLTTFDFFGILYGPERGNLLVDVYFLGTVPNHPIINQTIKNIILYRKYPIDLSYLTNQQKIIHNLLLAVVPLTQSVIKLLGKTDKKDIILPMSYFNNFSKSIVSYGVHYPKRSWKKD